MTNEIMKKAMRVAKRWYNENEETQVKSFYKQTGADILEVFEDYFFGSGKDDYDLRYIEEFQNIVCRVNNRTEANLNWKNN